MRVLSSAITACTLASLCAAGLAAAQTTQQPPQCQPSGAPQKVDGKPTWMREWGDEVDNWTDQNAPNRVWRTWGETALLRQQG